MPSPDGFQKRTDEPLYNSRIIKTFLEYLRENYPDIGINSVLKYAGMTKYEVEDPAHWFTQLQVDRFNDILVSQTGNPHIAREAGQYTTSSGRLGGIKQYVLGLLNTRSIFLLLGKLYPVFSRGATIKVKKLGTNRIEITSVPKPEVNEKPYQCENRMGTFESLPKLFTERLAKVEHPLCFHKGDDCCRYIISWERTPSFIWKRVRNYFILVVSLISLVLLFLLPVTTWFVFVLICACSTITLSLYSEHLERMELSKTVESQGNAAQDLLSEINIRYNNALLVQEIGQATSAILNIDKLISVVVNVMEKRLDFDRGMIMLSNKRKTRLVYNAGYGYGKEKEDLLRKTEFHLDKSGSRGLFVQSYNVDFDSSLMFF